MCCNSESEAALRGYLQQRRKGMQKNRRNPQPVGVLTKAIKILETLRNTPAGLVLKDIARQTGINKSTAYRFLSHLEREGYLARNEGGVYTIGLKLSQMGQTSSREGSLREAARPVLRDLRAATGESVNLAVMDNGEVLYLEVFESPHAFRLVSAIGRRRPLYSTGLGKALAAFLPPEVSEHILHGIQFQPFTPQTITNLAEFTNELEAVRAQGYAVDDEESLLGARCVAAPVLNERGESIASVSVAGPISRISEDKVGIFAAAVKDAVERIAAQMGFPSRQSRDVETSVSATTTPRSA
jgi:DNA-binding IclR family transcriptional regulator